eukprot:CAMPEP_0169151746 /NCGR_PEP_ID=MMETSP1015-20121227/51038_1 /TAXON_ID=342587 /ORGANISM="Karlodinium micrum, Strain CCMP2283" /LENGTH=267 /DNA_ID=CAMNT_0009221281 /DNA_START=61 /DNA_END=864 /DNA_ORIENTATION=-
MSRVGTCFTKSAKATPEPSAKLIPIEASNPLNNGCWHEFHFINAQGLKLHAYHAATLEEVRGIVILTHGIKAHAMFEWNNADEAGKHPLFALGESMGGGVVCRAAQMEGSAFAGLVLLAPMLSVENLAKNNMNRIMRPIGGFLSTVAPKARLLYLPPAEKFPEIHAQFKADPLNDSSQFVRTRTAMTMVRFCESIIHECADIQTPFLTMHSQDDTLVDPESSAVLMRDSKTTDKEFVHLDHMWHAFLHEPGSEEVVAKIAEWIGKRA